MTQSVRTIRLYQYELEMLPEYSCTVPTGTVDWKMWRCNKNFGSRQPASWVVAQYIPHENPEKIGIRVFDIEFLEGPQPLRWTDWTKIGPRLWASFEHDVRRGHDVQKFHAVQLLVGDHPEKFADEFVRVTRLDNWGLFRGLCDLVQAAISGAPEKLEKLLEVSQLGEGTTSTR